jgi:hypothetical protein
VANCGAHCSHVHKVKMQIRSKDSKFSVPAPDYGEEARPSATVEPHDSRATFAEEAMDFCVRRMHTLHFNRQRRGGMLDPLLKIFALRRYPRWRVYALNRFWPKSRSARKLLQRIPQLRCRPA